MNFCWVSEECFTDTTENIGNILQKVARPRHPKTSTHQGARGPRRKQAGRADRLHTKGLKGGLESRGREKCDDRRKCKCTI